MYSFPAFPQNVSNLRDHPVVGDELCGSTIELPEPVSDFVS
jgi:hypothetical protein